ncbi:MAG: YicC/YloC family endoribonuclease [Bacillota bacterium]
MIKSMTGFGRGEGSSPGYQITCEIKAVNHRYLDFNLRMSRRYNVLEDRIREKIRQYIIRGRIETFVNIEKTGESKRNIKVDNDLAMLYHNSLKDLAETLQIESNINIVDIFKLPEVFALEEDEEDIESIWSGVEEALTRSLEGLVDMRIREGQVLADDIRQRNKNILKSIDLIEERAPLIVIEHMERMKKRIQELSQDLEIDENRLLQEVAIFADRTSVAEELVRIKSHCSQMEELLLSTEPVGRKCDFLIQEMFREINTIASKANDLFINRTVVELKAELEKIREQVQNVE